MLVRTVATLVAEPLVGSLALKVASSEAGLGVVDGVISADLQITVAASPKRVFAAVTADVQTAVSLAGCC